MCATGKPSSGGSTLLNGLQAYYAMENVNDSSGNGLTLTNNNSVTFAAGQVNNAAVFNNTSNQTLSHADNAAYQFGTSTDFSISIWFKLTTLAYNVLLMGYGAPQTGPTGWGFIWNSTFVRSSVGDGTHRADKDTTTISDTNWHQMIATASRVGNWTVYFDGSSIGSASMSAVGSVNSSLGLNFGTFISGWYNGLIDETGIWNRVLTGTEITTLWNGGAGKTYPFT